MASLKLDIVNIVDEIHENFAAEHQAKALGDRLCQLTAGLAVRFDVEAGENTHEGLVLEFTGKAADLGVLIWRYESDPGIRKELHAQIKYVKPMEGSCNA